MKKVEAEDAEATRYLLFFIYLIKRFQWADLRQKNHKGTGADLMFAVFYSCILRRNWRK